MNFKQATRQLQKEYNDKLIELAAEYQNNEISIDDYEAERKTIQDTLSYLKNFTTEVNNRHLNII